MLTARDTGRLLQATLRVLADSERTDEIHVAEELTGRGRFAALRREAFTSAEGRTLLAERPELRSDRVDYDALRRLPIHTLGYAYVAHLDAHGLSADSQAAPTRYVDDPEIAYLMRRFRQTHDVWHALLGLGTAGHEEVILHAFSWGQLQLPVSALVVVFGTLKHIVLEARWSALRHALPDAWQSGRRAAPLLPVHWEKCWGDPLDEVRARYRVVPCSRAWREPSR
jgi:ubiquinone biosynthesis protein COQ4